MVLLWERILIATEIKNRQEPYGTLPICCQEIVFRFKSQKHPRCTEENNSLYMQ